MDEHGEGRITLSAFEDAALMVGMSLEQSQRLFARCVADKQGVGAGVDVGVGVGVGEPPTLLIRVQ